MRARRQPGPEQMTAGIPRGGSLGMDPRRWIPQDGSFWVDPMSWIPWDGSHRMAPTGLCSSAPLPSPSPQGLGHCHKDPGRRGGRKALLESTDLSIYML